MMETILFELFNIHWLIAVLISILLNTLISIAGVLPSTIITIVNIGTFGFAFGLLLSIAGEAIGAIVSFYLYRKGLQKWNVTKKFTHPYLKQLLQSKGWNAMMLIFSLRLMPFMPSGAVTFISACSSVKAMHFAIASTIGKIPALLLEALVIYGVFQLDPHIQFLLFTILGALLVFFWLKRRFKQRNI
ncbi:MAG: TVP38/TMEM64 family protein [Lysinibacillus sp.]